MKRALIAVLLTLAVLAVVTAMARWRYLECLKVGHGKTFCVVNSIVR